ncbi:MAG: flavin-containing monooxygenase [Chitinophagales bacterium]
MNRKHTNTLVIGASISGLATAAALNKAHIEYIIIERLKQVATPWRNHYERLHLHTSKRFSNLPYKKFDRAIPRYPSRQQVVDYMEDYQKAFDIQPVFNAEAIAVYKEGVYWMTETNLGSYQSKYLVMATGAYGKPKPIQFRGMETFSGEIMHSCEYKTGSQFKGKKVLVVGFGNSACEIAIDLHEQGASPSMAVRSPVNVIPRDILGIPVLELSFLLSRLPPRLADLISAPLVNLIIGDLTKLGLKRKPYGALEEIQKEGNVPLLDIGTIRHIRQGHIKIYGDIDFINGRTIQFKDGKREEFDTIVAGIGYFRDYADFVKVDQNRFTDLNVSASRQKYFGKDGLYFCGYWISPTGQIHEIAADAKKIAKDIAKKEMHVSDY